jgi:hypothetical protein
MDDIEEGETNRRRREQALRIIAAKLLQRRRALTDQQLLDEEARREAARAKRTRKKCCGASGPSGRADDVARRILAVDTLAQERIWILAIRKRREEALRHAGEVAHGAVAIGDAQAVQSRRE